MNKKRNAAPVAIDKNGTQSTDKGRDNFDRNKVNLHYLNEYFATYPDRRTTAEELLEALKPLGVKSGDLLQTIDIAISSGTIKQITTSDTTLYISNQAYRTQYYRTYNAFFERAKTMLEVARETGIERAYICWYVRDMRQNDQIAVVKKGLCPISKCRAGFLTTNPALFPDRSEQPSLFDREEAGNE